MRFGKATPVQADDVPTKKCPLARISLGKAWNDRTNGLMEAQKVEKLEAEIRVKSLHNVHLRSFGKVCLSFLGWLGTRTFFFVEHCL